MSEASFKALIFRPPYHFVKLDRKSNVASNTYWDDIGDMTEN